MKVINNNNNNVVNLKPKKDKKHREKRKKILISFISRNAILIAAVFILGYTVYVFSSPMMQTEDMNKEIAKIEEEIQQVKMNNEQLKEEVELVKTDAYVERVAREKLNLVKPGETLIMPAEAGEVKRLNKEGPIY